MAKSFSRPRITPVRGGLRLSDANRRNALIRYYHYGNAGGGIDYEQLVIESLPVFWVRADSVEMNESGVARWIDKSSSKNDALPIAERGVPGLTAADINGQDALDFVRNDRDVLMAEPIAINTYSIYIVFKCSSPNVSNNQLFANHQDTTSGVIVQNGFGIFIGANSINIVNRDGSGPQSKTIPFSNTTNYHLIHVRFKSVNTGNSELVAELDGATSVEDNKLNAIAASNLPVLIGSSFNAVNNNSLNGKIAEIILFDAYHSIDKKVSLYEYFNARYGFSLPTLNTDLRNLTYSSTIDSITNLFVRVAYKGDGSNLPLVILMHGFSQDATIFNDSTLRRWAAYGVFVAAVGMRGRNSASGTRDTSARELYDIADAVAFLRNTFPIDQQRVAVVGYSGGGGNVYGLCSKFPDLFCLSACFFGISDYGYDEAFGWYAQTTSGSQEILETDIGGNPSEVPNEYKSRDHRWSASNYKGRLRIYHDAEDSNVNVNHSTRLIDQLDADGFTNYVYNQSESSDTVRWLHGIPNEGSIGEANIAAESEIIADIKSTMIPSLPSSGSLKVNGYCVTSLFKVWLGDGESPDGTNRRATLVYDYDENSYTITPDIDAPETDMTVNIDVIGGIHAGKSASGTISTETEFNPSL